MNSNYYTKENIMLKRNAENKYVKDKFEKFYKIISLRGIICCALLFFLIYILNPNSLWSVILVVFFAYARIEFLIMNVRAEMSLENDLSEQSHKRLEHIEKMLDEHLTKDSEVNIIKEG